MSNVIFLKSSLLFLKRSVSPRYSGERGRNWTALAPCANQVLFMMTFLIKKSTIATFLLTSMKIE